MSNTVNGVPLDASHDYTRQFNKDERYYHRLSDGFMDVHECTFMLENLIGTNSVISALDFNICDDSITFKVPFTKGVGWNRGSINQMYKDGDLPQYETRKFPLFQKLWLQYKLDPLHVTCDDFSSYKMALDNNNMRHLNNNLLRQLLGLLGKYQGDFCACGSSTRYTETAPLHVVEGTRTLTDYTFNVGSAFQSECLPDQNYVMLLPQCMKTVWLRDEAIKDAYSQCCSPADNPAFSGMVPDMYMTVNGVSVTFLHDDWFDQIDMGNGVTAYRIPVFNKDAIAYKAARLDYTEIGPDKEDSGNHYRWDFYYAMFVALPEGVLNDWIVFEQPSLPVYTAPAAP